MEIGADEPAPKRGDLIYTNMGNRRERTWMILRSVPVKRSATRRYYVLKARWWELEPEMRMKLYRNAQRNGGQTSWNSRPLKRAAPKKQVVNFGL